MSKKFKVPNFDTWEKELYLGNLGAVQLTVDYDDVDHDEIQELLPLIVKALNAIPKEDVKAAIKRAREKDNEGT